MEPTGNNGEVLSTLTDVKT